MKKQENKKLDPVYSNLAVVEFKTKDELVLILSEQVIKVTNETVHFNLNWDEDNLAVIPLDEVLRLIKEDEPITMTIKFHDKEGTVMYQVERYRVQFKRVIGLSEMDYNQSGIKELTVEFTNTGERIITHNTI